MDVASGSGRYRGGPVRSADLPRRVRAAARTRRDEGESRPSWLPDGLAAPIGAGHEPASAKHERGDLFGGFAGDVREDGGVGVGGEHDGAVPEHVLHHPQVHPGGQRQGGRAVGEVMQPDRRHPGLHRESADGPGQPVGCHRVTAWAGEHVPTVLIGRTAFDPFQGLLLPVPTKRGDGRAVQSERPFAAGGLGWADDHMAVVLLQLLADRRYAGVQVDVAPAQPGRLATA